LVARNSASLSISISRREDETKSPGRNFNPLNAKLNPICHLLALLGAHHILHLSDIRVNFLLLLLLLLLLLRAVLSD